MNDPYEISKDIPAPRSDLKFKEEWDRVESTVKAMTIGDSFLCPISHLSCANIVAKSIGITIEQERCHSNILPHRVWRIQ